VTKPKHVAGEARSGVADATAAKTSVLHTAKTIAWSFFGVRRRGDHEQEGVHISPVHVVIAGFVGVFLLVAGLIVLVNWVAA
jgi:hypothetical protein